MHISEKMYGDAHNILLCTVLFVDSQEIGKLALRPYDVYIITINTNDIGKGPHLNCMISLFCHIPL